MNLKEQVTREQWMALFNAPSAACVFVILADGKGLEIFNEFFNAGKFIRNEAGNFKSRGYGKMVDDLMAVIKSMSPKEAIADAISYDSRELVSIRAQAKKIVGEGAAAASSLPEGDGYKQWIFDLAFSMAGTKTGGFFGIGERSVIDISKHSALNELEKLLGIKSIFPQGEG
jgi:hypothetical protein